MFCSIGRLLATTDTLGRVPEHPGAATSTAGEYLIQNSCRIFGVSMQDFVTRATGILCLFVSVSLSVIRAQSENPAACFSYEPSVVELTGTMVRKTFTHAQDKPETYWVLELSRPICVNRDPNEPENFAKKDVRLVQLVLDQKMYVAYKGLMGKQVIAKGTLFGEISAHHHTPVLLSVRALRIGG